jgi:lipid-A-disaccharide synthase
MSISLLLTSNGPGEVSSWVRPVLDAWRLAYPGEGLAVALVPCPYASGEEGAAMAGWPEPPRVASPRRTAAWLVTGRPPPGFDLAARGVVLHLGGDQAWAVALGARLGWPVAIYTETTGRWPRRVAAYMCADAEVVKRVRAGGAKPDTVRLVGNLMVDAAAACGTRRPGEATVALLPGSKPFKVQWVTPLFLQVAALVRRACPEVELVLPLAPTVPLAHLAAAAADAGRAAVTGGVTGQLVEREGEPWLVTTDGTSVRVLKGLDPRRACRDVTVALTLPGTNTAELAVLGVPMVVALPLHRPEVIPVDGLVGRLGSLPLLGPWMKRRLVTAMLARHPLVALPNARLGRAVTPEVVGVFTPEHLADVVSRLLRDPVEREAIAHALGSAMGEPGAAVRVVEAVAALRG